MRLALRSPDATTLEQYPLSLRDLRDLYPLINFGRAPTDETLEDFRLVIVREHAPETELGDTVTEGPPELREDGRWHQTWVVTPPDEPAVQEFKARLRIMVQEVAEQKRIESAGGWGPASLLAEKLKWDELAARGTNPSAPAPLLTAEAQERGMNAAQIATAVGNRRTTVLTRWATIETRLWDVLQRIDAADTLAEAQAIADEIEAV